MLEIAGRSPDMWELSYHVISHLAFSLKKNEKMGKKKEKKEKKE